jgi:hypothetical protein
MKKIFVFLVVFYGYLIAEYQTAKVGFIDHHFNISKNQVIELLKEIEQNLESEIGLNLFDYLNKGKPID